REREVVQNELRQRGADDPGLLDAIQDLSYPAGHPYRHAPGGTGTSVASLTLEDVCTFVGTHYAPSRATLVVAGDASAEAVERLLGATVGRLEDHATTPPPAITPARPRGTHRHERRLDPHAAAPA